MGQRKLLWKGIAGITMAVCLLLSGCGSGGNDAGNNDSGSKTGSSSPGSSTAPVSGDERTPITIGIAQSPIVQSLDDNYLTHLLEEKMNADIEFVIFPAGADDFKTKLAMLVTSNAVLPDVLTGGLSGTTLDDYAAKGVVLPLDDYYADPELSPNFHALDPQVQEFLLSALKISDQKIYSLFSYGNPVWNQFYHRAFINKEWLAKVGMEVPKTTDELTEVLRAFVTNDPNGNGKNDEIGLIGAKNGGYGQEVIPFIMSAFTRVDYSNKYLNVKDGVIYPSYTTPEWKQGLEYMNMLVEEGLLSPLSFTQDDQQLKAMGSAEEAVAGMFTCGSVSNFGPAYEPAALRMTLMAPLTGPEGVCTAVFSPSLPTKLWFITKDCEDPEFAFRMGDLFLEKEMSLTARYGEKGVDWSDDPKVVENYRGEYASIGIAPKYATELQGNIWTNPQSKHWAGSTPKYEVFYQDVVAPVPLSDYEKQKAEKGEVEEYVAKHKEIYSSFKPEEYIVQLQYTVEELEQISIEKIAIDQYAVDQAVAFITGVRPLSQWDSYIKELENMGLEKYIQTAQKAYDRSR